MATRREELYEEDFYAWTQDQAASLRRLAAERWNGPLDLAHLAEEVEDLGKAERNALFSQIERLIEHLLKLEYASATEPRRQWIISVDDARRGLERHLTPRSARASRRRSPTSTAASASGRRGSYGCSMTLRRRRRCRRNVRTAWTKLIDEDWLPPSRHGLNEET